jgi:hypothetical protein
LDSRRRQRERIRQAALTQKELATTRPAVFGRKQSCGAECLDIFDQVLKRCWNLTVPGLLAGSSEPDPTWSVTTGRRLRRFRRSDIQHDYASWNYHVGGHVLHPLLTYIRLFTFFPSPSRGYLSLEEP